MDKTLYWLWLSLGLGTANPVAGQLVKRQLDPSELFEMDVRGLLQLELFNPQQCRVLKSTPLDRAEKILDHCRQKGYHLITPQDADYPKQLLSLPDLPLVLYAQGQRSLLKELDNLPVITVVGTRDSSDYGRYVAESMSYDLANAGFIVVSGLAVGIDAFAHYGAIRAGKKTIAVLGCGLDVPYPSQTQKLREHILSGNGLILSELEPSVKPSKGYFRTRNRLLAGISEGVLVVEAPEHSGALITANCALEQGKDVFAVPSDIYDLRARGTLQLLRDGAILAANIMDIISPYLSRYQSYLHIGKQQMSYPVVQKRKRLPPRRPAVWEKKSPQQQDKPPLTIHPSVDNGENLMDWFDNHSAYTRFQPGMVLGKDWKEEKEQILQQVFQDLRDNSSRPCTEIKQRQQQAAQSGLSDIEQRKPVPKEQASPAQPPPQPQASFDPVPKEEHQRVLSVLTEQPQSLEQIAQACRMSVGQVTSILFELGVPDTVKMYPGQFFSL